MHGRLRARARNNCKVAELLPQFYFILFIYLFFFFFLIFFIFYLFLFVCLLLFVFSNYNNLDTSTVVKWKKFGKELVLVYDKYAMYFLFFYTQD